LPRWTPPADSPFPLALRTGRTLANFHSFYNHGRALPGIARLDDQPMVWIAPADAAARGLTDGDPVRIHNERGEFLAYAEVTDRIPAGTVWMHDGFEGANTLTRGAASLPDAATHLFRFSVGQSAYDARVEVSART
jgi:anaerobic selenocysteine-containing dehydrogenase